MNRDDLRSVFRLALPIVITQIGMVLYGTVDMFFVGRLGPAAIASVGLGSITYFTVFVVGMGVVMGIDSHSSKAFGAGHLDICGQLLVHTLVLALACASCLIGFFWLAPWAFRVVGADPAIVEGALAWLEITRWALFPGLAFVACRQFLQSMSVTRPLLWAIALGNAANALLDWILIYGKLGAPALGLRGSAVATLTANFVMLAVVAFAARSRLKAISFHFRGWHRRLFWDVLSLGLPGGLQFLVEVAVFSLVSALAARFGPETMAAHQLTLNLASTTFMVPMGIAHATAARVGQALGAGDAPRAAALGRAATAMAVAFMAACGACFALAPGFFIGLFSAGDGVLRAAVPLLYCSAAFQIFDGAQAVLSGALRGWGETKRPLLYNLIGHWVIGLPIGLWAAFRLGRGATGLWIGLVAGLAAVAVLLWLEWRRVTLPARTASSPASLPL